jgi:hypothetical protein
MKELEKAQLDRHQKAAKKRKRGDHRMVHHLIAKVAKEMAGHYYEHAAHDNAFFHHYPSEKFFIEYEWHRFITYAKQTLTTMLGNPMTPDAYKIDIHEALTLDATLPYSVNETQIVNIKH